MRTFVFGQAPSRSSDPRAPLRGRSGARLADLAGLTVPELADRFALANLLARYPGGAAKGDRFPRAAAARAARRARARLAGARVIFLGRSVAGAFGFRAPVLTWADAGGFEAAVVPHPSGVNLWWNQPENVAAARRFLRAAAREAKKR